MKGGKGEKAGQTFHHTNPRSQHEEKLCTSYYIVLHTAVLQLDKGKLSERASMYLFDLAKSVTV